MTEDTTRCGYIALLGLANAGKSTLLNAILGTKLVGVSRKAQTTRNKILGIVTEGPAQQLFLDTPGLHRGEGTLLNKKMLEDAQKAAAEADVVCFLIDSEKGLSEGDTRYLTKMLPHNQKSFKILLTKGDVSGLATLEVLEDEVIDFIGTLELAKEPEIHYVSAKNKEQVAELKKMLSEELPLGPWLYDQEQISDRSERFQIEELVREQVFRQLGEELPYGCAVQCESFEDEPNMLKLQAAIILARENHKGMVIGKRGAKIKEIGTEARKQIEKSFGKKVFLDLFVKVIPDWHDRPQWVTELGGFDQES